MPGEFTSHLIEIRSGEPSLVAPVPFQGRMTETEFETAVIAAPQVLGEELLVLGRQLADFSEDQQRLDVLALDKAGEIVLIELKVTESFRFTDVQALAYAGAYADLGPSHFSETLFRSLHGPDAELFRRSTGIDGSAQLEDVKSAILEFLVDFDSFSEWQPSQQVRIKLVAPGFTQRVLKNVKWLGEVYGMPIEAIRAQLYERDDRLEVTCERLLPLPGEEFFDLTVRDRERVRRERNEGRRRPRIFSLLVERGVLADGETLWLTESALRAEYRDLYDASNEVFSGQVSSETPTKLLWRRSPDEDPKFVSPAALAATACEAVLGREIDRYFTGVANQFTVGKGGPTLKEVAEQNELWVLEDPAT